MAQGGGVYSVSEGFVSNEDILTVFNRLFTQVNLLAPIKVTPSVEIGWVALIVDPGVFIGLRVTNATVTPGSGILVRIPITTWTGNVRNLSESFNIAANFRVQAEGMNTTYPALISNPYVVILKGVSFGLALAVSYIAPDPIDPTHNMPLAGCVSIVDHLVKHHEAAGTVNILEHELVHILTRDYHVIEFNSQTNPTGYLGTPQEWHVENLMFPVAGAIRYPSSRIVPNDPAPFNPNAQAPFNPPSLANRRLATQRITVEQMRDIRAFPGLKRVSEKIPAW
jgi:hypothetical protein